MKTDEELIMECLEKATSRNDEWNLSLINQIKGQQMTSGDRNYLLDYLNNA